MSLSFVAFASCSDDKENEQSGPGNVPENSSSVLSSSGKERGHSYVDLGLPSGTLWAVCNVGAATPQDYGNHYAWGEVESKESYGWSAYGLNLDDVSIGELSNVPIEALNNALNDVINDGYENTNYGWSTYKYGKENELTKYCNNSSMGKDGFTDNKTILELSDDAAYMNWGGKWRMPTKDQFNELVMNCVWVWTDDYNGTGIKGDIVYKAKNDIDKGIGKTIEETYGYVGVCKTPTAIYTLTDAHIFLPAADFYRGNVLYHIITQGNYFSSSLNTGDSSCGNAWALSFFSSIVGLSGGTSDEGPHVAGLDKNRPLGASIRAVIPGNY